MKQLKFYIMVLTMLFMCAVKSNAQSLAGTDSLRINAYLTQTISSNYYYPFKVKDYFPCNIRPTIYPLNSYPWFKHLGFMCMQELKLDKLTVMPIRFRLGSLNYVNYLEQK